jgi:hypothetical protein
MRHKPDWKIDFDVLPLETSEEDVMKRLSNDADLDFATSRKKHQLKKKGVDVTKRKKNIIKVENGWWIAVKIPTPKVEV